MGRAREKLEEAQAASRVANNRVRPETGNDRNKTSGLSNPPSYCMM